MRPRATRKPVFHPPERSSMSSIRRHTRPERSARPCSIDPLEPRLLFASFGFQTARTVSAGVRPATLAVADFNGDGFPDIAAGNTGGTGGVSVLLGNGNGTYHAGGSVIAPFAVSGVVTADVNGDQFADLLLV